MILNKLSQETELSIWLLIFTGSQSFFSTDVSQTHQVPSVCGSSQIETDIPHHTRSECQDGRPFECVNALTVIEPADSEIVKWGNSHEHQAGKSHRQA